MSRLLVLLALTLLVAGCSTTDEQPVSLTGRIDACRAEQLEHRGDCLVSAATDKDVTLSQIPGIADAVATAMAADAEFRPLSCHQVIMEAGRQLAARLGADAVVAHGSPACTGGLYRGALTDGGDLSKALTLCETLVDDTDRGYCAHGVGHAVWFRTNEVAALPAYCTGPHATACLAGAFMDISDASGRDPSALAVCASPSLTGDTLDSCYVGLVTDVTIAHPQEGLGWCRENATTSDRLPENCWFHAGKGIALGLTQVPDGGPQAVAGVRDACGSQPFCLDGAARILGEVEKRKADADVLCAEVIELVKRERRPGFYCGTLPPSPPSADPGV